jgi:hypothetical protein
MSGQQRFEDALRELAQQQSALSQQQAALLQLQTESLRLQRLLIERAIGEAPVEQASIEVPAAAEADVVVTAAVQPDNAQPEDDSPVGDPPQAGALDSKRTSDAPSAPPPLARSRAARYMQPPSERPARLVNRHDIDRLARLYETGETAQLVLHFGEYRGATLLQVAATDPDYVHRLALSAQRPEVRAAARQLVIALEEIAAHGPHTTRSGTARRRNAG